MRVNASAATFLDFLYIPLHYGMTVHIVLRLGTKTEEIYAFRLSLILGDASGNLSSNITYHLVKSSKISINF